MTSVLCQNPAAQDALSPYGGVVTAGEMARLPSSLLLQRISEQVLSANKQVLSKASIHMIANPTFNAVATTQDELDIIGIFAGASERIVDLAASVLARPDRWVGVGDSSIEGGGPIPKDQRRSVFALEVASGALHFILSHEIGHLLRGHLLFLARRYDTSALTELSYARGLGVPSFVLRAMEIDADTVAAQTLVDSWLRLPIDSSPLSRSEILCARLFGVATLFALLKEGEDELQLQGSLERTHPAPHVRFILTGYRSELLLANERPEQRAQWRDAQQKSSAELAACFPELWAGCAVRTSELKEVIETCRRCEPEFLEYANARARLQMYP